MRILKLWATMKKYRHRLSCFGELRCRLQYLKAPLNVIDLLAIVPYFVSLALAETTRVTRPPNVTIAPTPLLRLAVDNLLYNKLCDLL